MLEETRDRHALGNYDLGQSVESLMQAGDDVRLVSVRGGRCLAALLASVGLLIGCTGSGQSGEVATTASRLPAPMLETYDARVVMDALTRGQLHLEARSRVLCSYLDSLRVV